MYSDTIRFTGLSSGVDTAGLVKSLMKAEGLKLDRLKRQRQTKEWQQAAYRDVAAALENFQKTMLEFNAPKGVRTSENYKSLVAEASSSDFTATVTDAKKAGDLEFTVIQSADKDLYKGAEGTSYDMNTKLSDLPGFAAADLVPPNKKDGTPDTASDQRGVFIDGEFVVVDRDINDNATGGEPTVQDFADALKTKGISLKYNSTLDAFTMEGEVGKEIMSRFSGTAASTITNALGVTSGGGTRLNTARNAKVEYFGKEIDAVGNKVTIEGVEIILSDKLAVEEADTSTHKTYNVDVKADATATKDMIKNFVTEYNKLIDTIAGYTDKSRPKNGSYSYYEPLLDEEKDAMSEKQIEQWEAKAKTGIMYRDNLLTSVTSQMRAQIYTSVELDSVPSFKSGSGEKSLALFEIGITTSSEDGYIGKLQIDEEKLTKALEEDIDAVEAMFTQVSTVTSKMDAKGRAERLKDEKHGIGARLNEVILNAISTTDGLIAGKAGVVGKMSETDNTLYNELRALDDKIYQMNKMLAQKENNYYSMFSSMENAISQSNNQMSALMSMA